VIPQNLLLVLGALVLAGVMFRLNVWRALVWLKPSRVSVEQDAPADQMKVPEGLSAAAGALRALGFEALGSRYEKVPLAPAFISYDFANAQAHAYATVYAGKFGRSRLYFLTPTQGNGFVITADFRRPSREEGKHYLAGGLPNVPPERLLKAHHKRLEGFTPVEVYTPEARIEAARAWLAGPARREIRQQNLNGLVSSVLSGLLFAMAAAAAIAMLLKP
jgi:hypothetical protein